MPVRLGQTLRFGPFTLDPRCGELRTNGTRIKLQGQPIQVLELLLEKPGELVTREEIRQTLWSSDTFVDFDHNLNTAIKKLRQALGDEAETPKYIETLPRHGYRFIGEVSHQEERQTAATGSQSSPEQVLTRASERRHKTRRSIWISVGLLTALLICSFVIYRRLNRQPSIGGRLPLRVQLKLRGSHPAGPSLSRDGRYLFYWGGGQLWIKDLQEGTDDPLPGTEGALNATWSPDGRSIAIITGSPPKLKKIALDSRIITEICNLPSWWGMSWGTSNVILVENTVGVQAVFVATGRIQLLSGGNTDWVDISPKFLPDGNHYVFIRIDRNRHLTRGSSGILYVGTIDGRPPRSLNIRAVGYVRYAADHLLYNTQHGIFSQPFDASELRVTGKPTLLIPSTANDIYFSVSENGTLVSYPVFTRYKGDSELRLVTREGKPSSEAFAQGYTDQPRFSPDGKRIAYDQVIGNERDIWIYDLERRMNTRLTPGDSMYSGPVWSPDGRRIAYQYRHTRARGIAVRNSDGSGEPEILFENTAEEPFYYWPRSWSPTNDSLFITIAELPNGVRKSGVLCLAGDRKVTLLPAPKNTSRTSPMISPDGKWLAYYSYDAGGSKVFVQPYPEAGGDTLVSIANGSHPQWRADGRELFFLSEGKIQAISINRIANRIKEGQPTALFDFPYPNPQPDGSTFDSSPDGQLFVINAQSVPIIPTDTVDVIINWDLLVKK